MNVNPVIPWEMQAISYGFLVLYLALLAMALVLVARNPRFSTAEKLFVVLLIIAFPLLGAAIAIVATTINRRRPTVPNIPPENDLPSA